MNISLPESLKEWVEAQVSKKGYSTASEFVRDVLRREQEDEAREKIDDLLEEGLKSGKPIPLNRAEWRKIRADGLKLARRLRKK